MASTSDIKCPVCGSTKVYVKDSRSFNDGEHKRRRRECGECGHRWTTVEVTLKEFQTIDIDAVAANNERDKVISEEIAKISRKMEILAVKINVLGDRANPVTLNDVVKKCREYSQSLNELRKGLNEVKVKHLEG